MELRKKYERASINVISFESTDIITSSGGESMSTGGDNIDKEGWTPIEW